MRSPRRGFLYCPGLMRSLENRRKDGDHDGIETLGGRKKWILDGLGVISQKILDTI